MIIVKFIHTADWHLGKMVHGLHMTEDQSYILQQFLNIVKQEKPDAVIVAGDLYDRAIPPKEAVDLLDNIFTSISKKFEIPLIAISGNHDSPNRLRFGSSLFRKHQLHLTTHLEEAFTPIRIGTSETAHIYTIPYTEPFEARQYFEDDTITTHQQAMERIINEITNKMDYSAINILVSHAFIRGGTETDSEEQLTMVGNTPSIDSRLFQPFDYIALGHLHRSQYVDDEKIRYSGSILKYSFSEAKDTKSVTVVDVSKAEKKIKQIPLQPKRDLKWISGYFDEIITGSILPPTEDYIGIELLDDGQLIDPVSKLRTIYPNLLHLEKRTMKNDNRTTEQESIRKKREMSHEELFAAFYNDIKGQAISTERKKIIQEVTERLMHEEREID
ncbi:exonuclease SbcCD subunit D [Gracilibacillus halotolerans]|nr:exonuclease SbcCD subunit D [Gracilibacillus halotolerans]